MKTKLPEGWKEIKLGNQEYFTILSSGIDKFEGEKDYLSTESIQGTKIKKIECIITYKNRPSRANMQPVLNSVWFAKMQATLKVYSFEEENKDEMDKYLLSTGFAGIKVNEKLVSPRYLRLMFISDDFNELKDKLCSGSTQRSINNQAIENISLVVPSLSTQQKIISILEKAEKAKELRKEADALTKEFLKAVFMEMFGDPNTNVKKWKKVPTIEVCECIVPGRDKPKSFTGDTPWITTEDLYHLGKTCASQKGYGLSKNEISQVRARIIPKNSVILTCVGNLGIVSVTSEEVVMNQQLHAFICSEEIHPIFLMYNLSIQTDYMYRNATSTTVPYMNKTVCNSIPTTLPPIELQNKFASIVKEVEAMKDQQKHSKEHLDNLFNVLMQKAFKGELLT